MTQKRFALYSRVSTSDQSTQTQVDKLIEFAHLNNHAFEIFEEKESSRKTRPIKQEVLKRLRNMEFDGVIVFKLDRWARSSRELILEIEEFIKKDIEFISITDNLDFSSATGKLHFHILSAFSEFERSLISERTKAALARIGKTKKLGRPVGSKDKKKRKTDGYILRGYQKKVNRAKQSSPK